MPKKNMTQYSHPVDLSDFNRLLAMGRNYIACYNYICSRYSGPKSILTVNDKDLARREIRDPLTGRAGAGCQWKLPARIRNLAIEEALGSIRSVFSNTLNAMKERFDANEGLCDQERDFLKRVLNDHALLQQILLVHDFDLPEEMPQLNKKKMASLVRRVYRKCRGSIPHSARPRLRYDPDVYSYEKDENGLPVIALASETKNDRITVSLKDAIRHGKTLTVILHPDTRTIEIHANHTVESKRLEGRRKTIGLDKGYTDLLACSSGQMYGAAVGRLLSEETEAQNEKLAVRNRIWAQIQKCEENGEHAKAERIRKNNFGRKKWNAKRNRAKSRLRSEINHTIRQMIQNENPCRIVLEKLNFQSWNKKFSRKVKRKLSRWCKGYLDERIVYIASLFDVEIVYINPAYTSQVCSKCGCMGERSSKRFVCAHCGHREDADLNAAGNILERWKDEEITRATPFKKVREIILARTEEWDRVHAREKQAVKQKSAVLAAVKNQAAAGTVSAL